MCGIAGILSSSKPVRAADLKLMTGAIVHRGPEGDGHWINSNEKIGLGHRRLAIIDLSHDADQPMKYLDGRYSIIYNGEIYNYIEIREELVKKGYKFKSTGDTEVLLALFAEKQERCLDDLDGMFSFAIWDEKEQRLFCARDRFGEKPFYYTVRDDVFYFGSEMKALWAAGIPKTTNNKMLFNYFVNDVLYNPNDLSETFYEGISKLKAAHYFYITPENIKPAPKRYWDIDYKKAYSKIDETEAKETFRELFFESVARRLRSDVAVGSSLSGGLDSSAVVCIIDRLRENSEQKQMTFSARFPGFAKDEGKFMQIVIDRTRVDPHFVFPDEKGLYEDFETLCVHQEEPFGSASIYAQFCVMRSAKENDVTVLLDGQGADEILAGYIHYFSFYLKQLRRENRQLYKSEKNAYIEMHGLQSQPLKTVGKRILDSYMPESLQSRILRLKSRIASGSVLFLSRDFFREYDSQDFFFSLNHINSLNQALYKSTFEGELEDLLRYADRNSMAHSREVRLPFLSHKLVEFMFNLPEKFKLQNGITKYLMRQSFSGILPDSILNRMDKISYEPPQNKWLKSRDMINSILITAESLKKRGIMDKDSSINWNNEAMLWKILMSKIIT